VGDGRLRRDLAESIFFAGFVVVLFRAPLTCVYLPRIYKFWPGGLMCQFVGYLVLLVSEAGVL